MLKWLERAVSGRVFLDDGTRQITYGEAARFVADKDPPNRVVRPRLTIESILETLAVASRETAVLVGTGLPEPDSIAESGPGTLLFTSGSSGQPKPVFLSESNWAAAAEASMRHIGHGPEDTWLLAMPLQHVAGLGIVVRSAYAGGTVRLQETFEPRAYAAALRQVTLASVVPTMLSRVLDVDSGRYRGLRAVLVGGGPIPEGLLERASERGLPVLPTYGMTETCGQVATLRPGEPLAKRAHPLPDVTFRIGGDGRIEVRGPMVASAGRDGWFRTGDTGLLDEDGALVVTGRADDMIVTGGENVSPAVVEAALIRMAGVEEVVVVGVPSEEWGMEVGAVYTGEALPEDLAGVDLPSHARPRQVVHVESLPSTSLGKPDRQAVRMLLSGHH